MQNQTDGNHRMAVGCSMPDFLFQSFPDNHLGRVYYGVYYDYIAEELTVTIQRIKNLPKSSTDSGNTNKTYMK